jgi:16S rRNA (guanine1516-N2)-methyltransferase
LTSICLLPTSPLLFQAASQLAAAFHLPLVSEPAVDASLLLYLTEERLELRDIQSSMGPVYVDFLSQQLTYRCLHGGGRRQALAKAVGLKHGAVPTVVDATAGLGREAFVLACLGCQVRMVERSSVIAALLHDGLQRAQGDGVVKNLYLIHQDAQSWLLTLSESQYPDVIYLDPMYPQHRQKALVKKEMRMFRAVVGDDADAPALLELALNYARQRVVVKRPQWAPALGDRKPAFAIMGETTRFDVYN